VESTLRPPVLIVDDSLTVRMDLREAFEAAGVRVVTCERVADARDALSGTAFGVVLLDVVLPDGDGISLLGEIRNSPLNEHVPVLLLSSEAEVRDRVRGLRRGADDYLGKPYDAAHVVARTKELLASSGSRPRGSERTIVVVDDSATFRGELGAALREAGYRVVTAETGEKGLLVAAEVRPDAVIVDEMLPGIDGQTVVRRMKLDGSLRRTPVLVLTGSDRSEDEVAALESGADAFARKSEELASILARVGAMLRARGAERLPESGLTATSIGPKRILAVDDSPALLDQLSTALRRDGYDVVTARSGEEALELIAIQPVDCILLDLLLPGLSGEQTCRRIREAPATRDVPIIVHTSQEESEALGRAIDAGADDYVTKSGAFDVVRARIRAQLRRRQSEEESRVAREQAVRQQREADEARAARELASVRAALLADLAKKNEELCEADRRKDAFLGALSHELRNPLAPIKNALWIVQRSDPGSEQAARSWAILDRQVNHLSQLVDDLLDVTRVARGKIRLTKSPCDLAELLGKVVLDHEPVLAARQIRLASRLAQGPIWVDADVTRITQVVGNLVQNSGKFTNPGGRVTLTLGTDGASAIISVMDTGIGIAPEMLGRLFEAFTQADESLERSGGGLGLGLALVKGLVELHGGAVEAKSAGRDRGSEFIVRLPLGARAEAGRAPQLAEPPSAEARRVLIIDDNVDAASSLKEALGLSGHVVEVAYDGPDGLAKARTFRPDVALCDIGLPGMDGYTVARAIRSDPAMGSTVLVAFTGYARPDDERRAAEAGFDAHLAKPVSIEKIERALQTPRRART
jgi:DNA-binding response OmpR family regulator